VDSVFSVIGGVLLLCGAAFVVVGGIGVLRLPDFYTRIHGAGITDTLGAGLILTGLMFEAGLSIVTVKLLMILLLLWITSPTATYALAHAAFATGLKPRLKPQWADGEEGSSAP